MEQERTTDFCKRASILFMLVTCTLWANAQDLGDLGKYKPKALFENFKQGDPFAIAGGIGINTKYYESFGASDRQSPFTWSVNANINLSFYKINMPFSMVFSAQNRDFAHPFNPEGWKENLRNRFVRVGASPFYKWVKLHLGHRTMDFSSLTYSGQTFLGVGTELTPGKFRISAMYGLIPTSEPRDLAVFEINREVFNRRATTVMVGYGDNTHSVDLIFMKAKDKEEEFQINSDSISITPQENMVIGLQGKTVLFKKLAIQAEVASSAYSMNSLAPEVTNRQILHPNFIISRNESTTYTIAAKGGWKYQGKGFNFGMDYERLSPGYKTMGAYYFNDDLQNITANTGWNFSKIQLAVNLSAGVQNNNLDETKPATVRRVIMSGNANYSLKNFQTSFTYSNFSNQVDYVLNPDLDSLNAVVATENMALTASYTILGKGEDGNKHAISFMTSLQRVSSPTSANGPETNDQGSRMLTSNLSYNNVPTENGWRWTARANFNQNALSGTTLNRYGVGMGVSKKLWDNKINFRVDNNYFITQSEILNQQALNLRVTTGLNLPGGHSVNMKVMMNNQSRNESGARSTRTEMGVTMQYNYRFQANYEAIKGIFKKGEKQIEDAK